MAARDEVSADYGEVEYGGRVLPFRHSHVAVDNEQGVRPTTSSRLAEMFQFLFAFLVIIGQHLRQEEALG